MEDLKVIDLFPGGGLDIAATVDNAADTEDSVRVFSNDGSGSLTELSRAAVADPNVVAVLGGLAFRRAVLAHRNPPSSELGAWRVQQAP